MFWPGDLAFPQIPAPLLSHSWTTTVLVHGTGVGFVLAALGAWRAARSFCTCCKRIWRLALSRSAGLVFARASFVNSPSATGAGAGAGPPPWLWPAHPFCHPKLQNEPASSAPASILGMAEDSALSAARRRAGALAGQFPGGTAGAGAAPEAPGARAKRVNAELRVDYWEDADAMGGPAAMAESLAEHPAPGAGKALPLTRPPFQAQGRLRALDERTGKEYSLEVRALTLPVPRPARPSRRPRPRRLGLVASAPAATGRLTAPHGRRRCPRAARCGRRS